LKDSHGFFDGKKHPELKAVDDVEEKGLSLTHHDHHGDDDTRDEEGMGSQREIRVSLKHTTVCLRGITYGSLGLQTGKTIEKDHHLKGLV